MIFNLFRKKNPKKQLHDINGTPIHVGDLVESLRYDMGKCVIIEGENGIEYESIATKQKVSFIKMIDAATSFQKVKKLH